MIIGQEKNRRRWLSLLVSVFLIQGCETISLAKVDRYASNPTALRNFQAVLPKQVSVEVAAVRPSDTRVVQCFNEDIKLPDGETFSEYVQLALLSEFTLAGIHAVNAPLVLSATLEEVDFSFIRPIFLASFGGTWTFRLTVSSSNGNTLSVVSSHSYDSGYTSSRCQMAAEYLMPAVQKLVLDIAEAPGFPTLLE